MAEDQLSDVYHAVDMTSVTVGVYLIVSPLFPQPLCLHF